MSELAAARERPATDVSEIDERRAWEPRLPPGTRAALALTVSGLAYTAWARRRNRRIRRRPVCRADGSPIPSGTLVLSDGAAVSYVEVGSGVPLVLVAGADGMKETFRYQIPAFARHYRVLCADVRKTFPRDATFDRLVDDVAELVEARGASPAIILGQSLGGAVAVRFATRYPDLTRALVISNSLTRVSYDHLGFNRTGLILPARFTVRYLPTRLARLTAELWSSAEVWIFDDSPGRENVIEYALWTGGRTVPPREAGKRVALFHDVDLQPELGRITVPALILRGPRDAYMPPDWWREMTSGIRDSHCVDIPETGHCSHVSMPGAFNAAVLDWLEVALGGSEDEASAR